MLLGNCRWPTKVWGHWGLWHFSGSLGCWESTSGLQSPGLLRILTFLRVTRTLGKCQWPSKVPATEATDISKGHRVTEPFAGDPGKCPGPLMPLTFLKITRPLGCWESAGGPAKSGASEATDISESHITCHFRIYMIYNRTFSILYWIQVLSLSLVLLLSILILTPSKSADSTKLPGMGNSK